jgi:hypothetical protein
VTKKIIDVIKTFQKNAFVSKIIENKSIQIEENYIAEL